MCLWGAWAPHLLFLFVLRVRGLRGAGMPSKGFRIDWCFRRGLYESEGGVACQHLVLLNSRADFPYQ